MRIIVKAIEQTGIDTKGGISKDPRLTEKTGFIEKTTI